MFYLNLVKHLQKEIDQKVCEFNIDIAVSDEPVSYSNRLQLQYNKIDIGDSWGELFSCAWLKLTATVSSKDISKLFLKLDINCEALLFDNNGVPMKGFTNGSSAFGVMGHLGPAAKRYYPLQDFIDENGDIELWLDAGMNDLFGNVKCKGKIETVQVVSRNMELRQLYYNVKDINALLPFCLKEDYESYKKYSSGLKAIKKLYSSKSEGWLEKSQEIANDLMNTPSKHDHYISSIGHAHLDLAWLWPIRETIRKGARTFANALYLIENYDDFYFGASQPQLYEWIKIYYPELYEKVKKQVAAGRWEVQGGMWVEADTNVTGEESLVRQMLYGKKFFREEFEIDVKSLWLPDVFGYSGNMPQIIKKSGMDYFMTIKISWNDTNKFPHHSFNWQGIDGSTVLAHMPPEGQYNSPADVLHVRRSMNRYKEKQIDNKTLNLFGVGNGGGGPSPYHVERIRCYENISPLPKIKMETSDKFFKKLNKKQELFPTYNGELYLEKHRGTYTSQGKVKYYNRKLEQKLKTVETLLTQINKYETYQAQLEVIWKEVLLYQFHDILPGSSIKRVYDECLVRYEKIDNELTIIIEESTNYNITNDTSFYNPLLEQTKINYIENNIYNIIEVAPLSNTIVSKKEYNMEETIFDSIMENKKLLIKFGHNGEIISVYDKISNKETLKAPGNILNAYMDVANAWDIFKHYKKLPHKRLKLIKTSKIVYKQITQIHQEYVYKNSTVKQVITLDEDSTFINFELDVDWQDNKRMLRVAYPLNLQTDYATFDIQFGHLKRRATNTNSIEKAQYEMCGHNWVDMRNDSWGAALFTDSKYGFNVKNNTLDLHLIKSTNRPAKQGDIGKHRIKYGLYINSQNESYMQIDKLAMHYNTFKPLLKTSLNITNNVFELSNNNITYSTIKQADDKNGTIIRLYERSGTPTTCELHLKNDCKMYETSLIEDNATLLETSTLQFEPFEIKTIKIIERQVK